MFPKFLLTLILWSTFHTSLQFEYVSTIIEEFKLKNPYLIGSFKTDISPELMKLLFFDGLFVTSHTTHFNEMSLSKNITNNVIAFLHPQSDGKFHLQLPENYHGSLFLIADDQSFEELINIMAIQTKIHQKVFLLKKDSQEIYEGYTINNFSVKKKLGGIDQITNKFKWQRNVNPDFVKRRSDFHGIVLKVMVEFSGLDMNADYSYLVNAPYFPNNESYQVNEFTYGLFNDILEILQDELNFTTILYKRKEPAWGYIYPQTNGSYIGTGAIGDIFFKRVDLAVAPFYYVIDRAYYVDYLPDISTYFAATYIPITNEESVNFDTYMVPFTYSLWIALTVMGTIFSIIHFLFLQLNGNLKHFGFNHIWSSFTVFFGEIPPPSRMDSESYYKITITSTLLCGTVIWMSYGAGLTSELSVTSKAYPFTDMNSFSKLNWR